MLLVERLPHVRANGALQGVPALESLLARLLHERRVQGVSGLTAEGVALLGDGGEDDVLPLAGVGVLGRVQQAADEVVLVPASRDRDAQERRLETGNGVGLPPVPDCFPLRLAVRVGEVLDHIVHEHDLETQTRDRLARGRAGDDNAAPRSLPLAHRARVGRNLDAPLLAVLLDEAADLAAPGRGELRRVRDQGDLPVRVLPQQPDRKVNRRQSRLTHAWRHGNRHVAILTGLDGSHGFGQLVREILDMRSAGVGLIELLRALQGVGGLPVDWVVRIRGAEVRLAVTCRALALGLLRQPLLALHEGC